MMIAVAARLLLRCWDYKMYVIEHGGEWGRWRGVAVEGFGGRRQGAISRLSVNNKNTQQSTSKWQTINTMKNMCIIVVREGEGEEYINNAYKWNNFVKNDRKLISLCVLDWRRVLEIERKIYQFHWWQIHHAWGDVDGSGREQQTKDIEWFVFISYQRTTLYIVVCTVYQFCYS